MSDEICSEIEVTLRIDDDGELQSIAWSSAFTDEMTEQSTHFWMTVISAFIVTVQNDPDSYFDMAQQGNMFAAFQKKNSELLAARRKHIAAESGNDVDNVIIFPARHTQ